MKSIYWNEKQVIFCQAKPGKVKQNRLNKIVDWVQRETQCVTM